MLCPHPNGSSTSRKQVRFESPIISSYRKVSLPSPPPTPPLFSLPRSAHPFVPPPIPPSAINPWQRRTRHHHRLILSRSLPNSPQHKVGLTVNSPSKGNGSHLASAANISGRQRSLAHRLLQVVLLRPSRSSDSLLLSQQSKTTTITTSSTNTSPSKTTFIPSRPVGVPQSSSLTLISSPSPAICRIWEEERRRRALLIKFQLAAQLQEEQFRADYARHFQSAKATSSREQQQKRGGPNFPNAIPWAAASRAPPFSSSSSQCQQPPPPPPPAAAAATARPTIRRCPLPLARVNSWWTAAGDKLSETEEKAAQTAFFHSSGSSNLPFSPSSYIHSLSLHHQHHQQQPIFDWEQQKVKEQEENNPWPSYYSPPSKFPFSPLPPPPPRPPHCSIPISHSFPPPMAASSSSTAAASASSHHHHPPPTHQHSYNELEDFNEDFVPRSSNTARQNRLNSMDSQASDRVQIRRMSLKEFSGLDLLEENRKNHQQSQQHQFRGNVGGVGSPLLHPWKGGQLPALGSLIDKFSSRRRSSSSGGTKLENHIGNGQQPSAAEESPYTPFDRAIEGISQAIRETAENGEKELEEEKKQRQGRRRGSANLEKEHGGGGTGRGSFGQILQRLTNIRNHLNSTLQTVPNVSPRKAHTIEREKLLLLGECRLLVGACKEMARAANPSPLLGGGAANESAAGNQPMDCLPLVQTAVDSAERLVESVEVLIRKSNSIFQAQQLTTNADQLLKALADAVKEVEKCQKGGAAGGGGGGGGNFEQPKQIIRSSTTLAANLISFTELIRGMG